MRYYLLTILLAVTGVIGLKAQKNEFNPIETGVNSLSIAPDARGASMGDLGAATDPDANSQFWNPSKYAFAYGQGLLPLHLQGLLPDRLDFLDGHLFHLRHGRLWSLLRLCAG